MHTFYTNSYLKKIVVQSVKKIVLIVITTVFSYNFSYGQIIKINEIMPSNMLTIFDDMEQSSDWLELYNTSSDTIKLLNYGLSDKKNQPFLWRFPNVNILPNDYMLIYASGRDVQFPKLYWETVIDWGDTLKYLIPDADTDLNWPNIDFNDNSWNAGPSGLGYGDDGVATEIPKTLSVFIRKSFNVDSPESVAKAILHMDFDDGFVAYLNGVEFARSNLGTLRVLPDFDIPANSGGPEARLYNDEQPRAYVIDSIESMLKTGENVLAVQVHNSNWGSSDLTVIPILSLAYISAQQNSSGVPSYITINEPKLHTNFKIGSKDTLYLTDSNGVQSDFFPSAKTDADISLGRLPDGSNNIKYYINPTPEKTNGTVGYTDSISNKVSFSMSPSVYRSEVSLTLSTLGSDKIYYSLDGSNVTEESELYTGAIALNTTTTVKTCVINTGILPGKVTIGTFVINKPSTLPIISISTNPNNLWDNEIGIYVMGNDANSGQPYFGANFWKDWERPAHMEMFETDGKRVINMDVGIRIFGMWSRAAEQKSFAVISRKKYGQKYMKYKFFPKSEIEKFKGLLLRNSGNGGGSMIKDAALTSLVANMDIDIQQYRPAAIYLNGKYWGILNIREKLNEHYISINNNIDTDSIDILEDNSSVLHGDNIHYLNFEDYLKTHDIAKQENYNYVANQIDISNFTDYEIVQIYFANGDWPGSNIKYWRKKSDDGKWRWLLFDTDGGFREYRVSNNSIDFALDPSQTAWPNPAWSTLLLRKLMSNDNYKLQFINRYADMLNTTFSPAHVTAHINTLSEVISDEIPLHYSRWDMGNKSTWNNRVDEMKDFGNRRQAKARGHILSTFGLNASHNVNIKISSRGAGIIKLNTIELDNFPWTGKYFEEVPIEVTAVANYGFRFVKWSGYSTSTSSTITISLTEDIELEAIYESDGISNPIVINEINYNSSDENDSGDWIELYNRTQESIDISSWIIKDNKDDHEFIFPKNIILESEEYIVICKDSALFANEYPEVSNFIGQLPYGLNNIVESVRLFNTTNQLVNEVNYTSINPWPETPNGLGHTLSLTHPDNNNSLPKSWLASKLTGTPEKQNFDTLIYNGVDDIVPVAQNNFELFQNYPNPFNTTTTISFYLDNSDNVKLTVYNLRGQIIKILSNQFTTAGYHEFELNRNNISGSLIPAGIYFYRLETLKGSTTKKFVVGNN